MSSFRPVASLPTGSAVYAQAQRYLLASPTRLERIDPSSGRVLATRTVPSITGPLVSAPDGLWAAAGSRLLRLDPLTLRTEQTLTAPGGTFWVVVPTTTNQAGQPIGTLYRQPLDGSPARPVSTGGPVGAVAAGTDLAATAGTTDLLRVDPKTGAVQGRYHFSQSMNTVLAGIEGDIAWVVEGGGHSNQVTGLDLRTGRRVALSGSAPGSSERRPAQPSLPRRCSTRATGPAQTPASIRPAVAPAPGCSSPARSSS